MTFPKNIVIEFATENTGKEVHLVKPHRRYDGSLVSHLNTRLYICGYYLGSKTQVHIGNGIRYTGSHFEKTKVLNKWPFESGGIHWTTCDAQYGFQIDIDNIILLDK